jgi:hypothetical protein
VQRVMALRLHLVHLLPQVVVLNAKEVSAKEKVRQPGRQGQGNTAGNLGWGATCMMSAGTQQGILFVLHHLVSRHLQYDAPDAQSTRCAHFLCRCWLASCMGQMQMLCEPSAASTSRQESWMMEAVPSPLPQRAWWPPWQRRRWLTHRQWQLHSHGWMHGRALSCHPALPHHPQARHHHLARPQEQRPAPCRPLRVQEQGLHWWHWLHSWLVCARVTSWRQHASASIGLPITHPHPLGHICWALSLSPCSSQSQAGHGQRLHY